MEKSKTGGAVSVALALIGTLSIIGAALAAAYLLIAGDTKALRDIDASLQKVDQKIEHSSELADQWAAEARDLQRRTGGIEGAAELAKRNAEDREKQKQKLADAEVNRSYRQYMDESFATAETRAATARTVLVGGLVCAVLAWVARAVINLLREGAARNSGDALPPATRDR